MNSGAGYGWGSPFYARRREYIYPCEKKLLGCGLWAKRVGFRGARRRKQQGQQLLRAQQGGSQGVSETLLRRKQAQDAKAAGAARGFGARQG